MYAFALFGVFSSSFLPSSSSRCSMYNDEILFFFHFYIYLTVFVLFSFVVLFSSGKTNSTNIDKISSLDSLSFASLCLRKTKKTTRKREREKRKKTGPRGPASLVISSTSCQKCEGATNKHYNCDFLFIVLGIEKYIYIY